jgi:hypothetical protein
LIRGVDAEDVLAGFSFAYAGDLRGRRITNGHLHATIDLTLPGGTYPIRGRGTFAGKCIGEVCCLTPPDDVEELSGALGSVRHAPSTIGAGAIADMAAALATGRPAP